MNQTNLNIKTKLLHYELVSFLYTNKNIPIILELLKRGSLNKLIIKLDDSLTIPDTTCLPITKKGYLTSHEQFIMLLNNLIYKFKTDFYFINHMILNFIELILFDNKYDNYLLCKKYIGNNNNIKYFISNYQKFISYYFYCNLKTLYKNSKVIQKFMNEYQITKLNFDINHGIIFEILTGLVFLNTNNPNLYYLFLKIDSFDNCNNSDNYFQQMKIIEEIIENYYIKIIIINMLVFT